MTTKQVLTFLGLTIVGTAFFCAWWTILLIPAILETVAARIH